MPLIFSYLFICVIIILRSFSFQIKPVSGTPLYNKCISKYMSQGDQFEDDNKSIKKKRSGHTTALAGMQLYRKFTVFAELEENKRWDKDDIIMKEFAPLARLGKPIPHHLIDALNAKVALSSNEAARKAHSGALWIAYTNNEVDAINKEQTDRLQSKDNPIRTIWARQV